MTIMLKPDLLEALDKAMKNDKRGYASAYIKAIPDAAEEGEQFPGHTPTSAVQFQLVYVLSNLQYWKGEEAKEAKKVIKAYQTKDPLVPTAQPELN